MVPIYNCTVSICMTKAEEEIYSKLVKCLSAESKSIYHPFSLDFDPAMAMRQPLNHQKEKIMPYFGLMFFAKAIAVETSFNACITSAEDIKALCKEGRFEDAMRVLRAVDHPNPCIYICILQEIIEKKALPEGKLVHAHINQRGFKPNRFLCNTLLNMYSKCGSVADARRVFEQMPERNVLSWTVMISAYTSSGVASEALKLFHEMQRTGVQPNQFTFSSVLPACGSLAALEDGMKIHEEIMGRGFQSDVFVGSALVDMYAKCGRIEDARDVFDKMHQRDVVSWNTMLAGYAQNGLMDEALRLFKIMPVRNMASWNAMIAGYTHNGHNNEALNLCKEMQLAGMKPDVKTLSSLLPAIASLAALEQGTEIHGEIVRSGFELDVFLQSALVDMYAKCGSIEKARWIFDRIRERDVVLWNAMIAGYAFNGIVDEALKLFQKMPELNIVSWNAMVAGYAQNGHVDEACNLFQKMPERNIVSWNTMITAYARDGPPEEALGLFYEMERTGFQYDKFTFASILSACAKLAALEQGMQIHKEIVRRGFQSDVFVANALLDMYAKCGSIDKARDLFDKMLQRDVVSWTAMITGYAMHGYGKEALKLFEQMVCSGMNPNHITLVCILYACCHAGLVEEGCKHFDSMSQSYGISPAMEHYGCIVDLLGRAGRLDEAEDFINRMPITPDDTVWGCLLGACRIHNNVELGEHVAEHIFELNPTDAAPYVLLSNIYAAAGRWDGIEKVRKLMKDRRIQKMPGCSWIEIDKKMHAFFVGDGSHLSMQKINIDLKR